VTRKTTTATLPRRTDYMRVDEMVEAELNPKGHDAVRIRGSIERWGFLEQAVLDERTGRLVHGHGRLHQVLALRADGQQPPDGVVLDDDGNWLWPVTRGWSSRSDAEAHQVGVTLNRLTEVGGWSDLQTLTAILDEANEMEPDLAVLMGFGGEDIDKLHAQLAAAGAGEGVEGDDWQGMPEFEQPSLKSAFHTTIHFATQEDADAFFVLIERTKAPSLWWPTDDGHSGSDYRVAVMGAGEGDQEPVEPTVGAGGRLVHTAE
jgi:hypothetical protein